MAQEICSELASLSLVPAINATGVILHTGLGRARFARSVAEHVAIIARSHATLEIDPSTGDRGDRQTHVARLLSELTGAEGALVVNNCAGAVVLTLSALCRGQKVILSRGQMVEIGGAFRMPEIVLQSGCEMVEVGCTNKTRISDYERAAAPDVAAILRCHPSNFAIVGFSEEPSLSELSALARREGRLLIDDLGSGCLIDTSAYGLPHQPTVQESLAQGADLVTFSGDKWLGGPQAGVIVGRQDLIDSLNKHPLARALRADKLALGALEATLRLHLEKRHEEIPVWGSVARPLEDIRRAAQRIKRACRTPCEVLRATTEIGSGSAPGVGLPTFCLAVRPHRPARLAVDLRRHTPPIFARVANDAVWIDPRTLTRQEETVVARFLSTWRES